MCSVCPCRVISVNYVKASDATVTALIEGGFFWWPEMLYVSFLSLAVLVSERE